MKAIRNCPICDTNAKIVFTSLVLNKYNVRYYQCSKCAFLFTEKPYWLEEAYGKAITDTDTGIMVRNINNAVMSTMLLKKWYSFDEDYLDYGGGYGLFVRLMRDVGYNFQWFDKYADPLICSDYVWQGNYTKLSFAFEVFEHFENPKSKLDEIFTMAEDLIFSTEIYDKGMKVPDKSWWYYQFNTGQHISFYSKKTICYIAKMYGLNLYQIAGRYWFTHKTVSKMKLFLFNIFYKIKLYHIYWITQLGFHFSEIDMNTAQEKISRKDEGIN